MGKLTDKVAKGAFWVLLEKGGVQLVQFLVTLVLARLLTPSDYGAVALLTVFISLSDVLIDSGLPKALVQKKKATQTDYDTVFFLSLTLAVGLYTVLFVSSPAIASFYRMPELSPMLRLLAVTVFFKSVNGVQDVELNRKMLFKLSFRISWVRAIVAAGVGVVLALKGFGAWALVWSSVAGGFAGMVARQLVIAWRPTLAFSWASARELWRFGWKMMVAKLVAEAYRNLSSLLIGRFYTRADLAFTKKGSHVPRLLVNSLDMTLGRVSFPALAKMQDDPERMRAAMRRMIRVSTFGVFPLMAACSICAKDLVCVLFGARWIPAAPYMALWCFAWVLLPFNTINVQAMTARGRSDVFLVAVIVRRLIGLAVMALTLRYGVLVFVSGAAFISAPLGVIVNAWPNRKFLGYTLGMQLKDVAPAFVLTLAAAAAMCGVCLLPANAIVRLLLSLSAGAAVYLSLATLLRLSVCSEIARSVLSVRKRLPSSILRVLERIASWDGKGSLA